MRCGAEFPSDFILHLACTDIINVVKFICYIGLKGHGDRRDMAFVLLVLLTAVLFLTGNGVVRCFYGRGYKGSCTPGEVFLSGLCVFIGTAEAAHLMAVFFRWPVMRMALVWLGMLCILTAVSLVPMWQCHKSRNDAGLKENNLSRKAGESTNAGRLLTGAFLLSVLLQIIAITTGELRCNTGDMTLETVRTFLAQDQLFGANALTGQPYEAGIPLRLKILCLPGLYSGLCALTGLDPEQVVCGMVPAMVLLGSYLAYDILGRVLLGKDRIGRILMLLVISVLFWCGGYMESMDGFLLLHCGYRGVAIRNAILIPFTVGMCLQKKWKSAVLGILAEACIVWTLYGMGACLLAASVLFLVGLWVRERRGGKA